MSDLRGVPTVSQIDKALHAWRISWDGHTNESASWMRWRMACAIAAATDAPLPPNPNVSRRLRRQGVPASVATGFRRLNPAEVES